LLLCDKLFQFFKQDVLNVLPLGIQSIEPEREPYCVREGGSRLCFARDPYEKLTSVN